MHSPKVLIALVVLAMLGIYYLLWRFGWFEKIGNFFLKGEKNDE